MVPEIITPNFFAIFEEYYAALLLKPLGILLSIEMVVLIKNILTETTMSRSQMASALWSQFWFRDLFIN